VCVCVSLPFFWLVLVCIQTHAVLDFVFMICSGMHFLHIGKHLFFALTPIVLFIFIKYFCFAGCISDWFWSAQQPMNGRRDRRKETRARYPDWQQSPHLAGVTLASSASDGNTTASFACLTFCFVCTTDKRTLCCSDHGSLLVWHV